MSASLAASDHKTKAAAHTTGPSPAVMGTYARQDLVFERGEGAWLITAERRALSRLRLRRRRQRARPRASRASSRRSPSRPRSSGTPPTSIASQGQERLAERLVAATFADRVFFCNSGAEACEGAIKAARRYHYVSGQPGALAHHHLRAAPSTAARWRRIAAGGNEKYLEGFGPPVEGFDHVPFGDLAARRSRRSGRRRRRS